MSIALEDLLASRPPRSRPATVRPLIELLTSQPDEGGDSYRLYEKELALAERQFKKDHPLGLRRDELNFSLAAPENIAQSCADKLVPFARRRAAWYCGDPQQLGVSGNGRSCNTIALARWLDEHSHDLRLWEMAPYLSLGEIARLHHENRVSGRLFSDIYKHPYLTYVAKLALSTWHWLTPYDEGASKVSWQRVMAFHKMFMDFDFGVTSLKLDVTIDHAHSWMNRRGPPEYTESKDGVTGEYKELWLDGEFGLMLSHKGVHVATVGLSTTNAGILLNQVQLRRNKGNRWLFKLPAPLLEHVVGQLYAACRGAGLPLFLVTGRSLRNEIRSIYPANRQWDPKAGSRIIRFYGQPLGRLMRGERRLHVNHLHYHEVVAPSHHFQSSRVVENRLAQPVLATRSYY